MSGPVRIQLSRAKGWRMPENTVNVARPGKWGNPFIIGMNRCSGHGLDYRQEKIKDAATAVRFFCEMLEIADRNYPSEQEIVSELRGKDLACWCKASPCHADVLLEIANR
jgi:hypothetical protein